MKGIYRFMMLLVTTLMVVACSSDGDSVGADDDTPVLPDPIKASFKIEISTTDSKVLLLDNTTEHDLPFTSVWDYGKGGGAVADGSGIEEVRYDVAGEYTIKLTVTSDGLSDTATKKIIVDDDGICPNGVCGNTSTSSLKGTATTFSVGMITRASYINGGGKHVEILKQEFNNLTSEYEMKMNVMYPSDGNYDFTAADAIVNFAQANNMDVHGHALIWHNSTPDWVKNFSGTDSEFEAMVEDYITTVVTRYKGKVRSWDVVNEALEDGSGHPLRNSVFRQKMGDDYVKKCFQFARNADPDCLLFYNDYNMAASSSKRTAMFALVDSMGDLIDGVGAQMHISYDGPSKSDIQAVVDGTVSRSKLLHFSELDIRANPNNDQTILTSHRADEQKAKFKEVVEIYNAVPLDNKFALTTWGLRDSESWLINFWGHIDWPLMFDDNYDKKPAYFGFIEGLE